LKGPFPCRRGGEGGRKASFFIDPKKGGREGAFLGTASVHPLAGGELNQRTEGEVSFLTGGTCYHVSVKGGKGEKALSIIKFTIGGKRRGVTYLFIKSFPSTNKRKGKGRGLSFPT